MLYELVNMGDHYTFKADNLATAALVTILLGDGQYCAKPIDDEGAEGVPFFMLGGADEWFAKHFDGGIDALAKDFITGDRRAELVTALRSVLIGNRAEYEETLPMVAEDQREAWIAKWKDRHRSSMNNIGGRAEQWAEKIERGP